jgi:hypothetical protein
VNSRAQTSFASKHDHFTCLRLGLTQLRYQSGITSGPFCAFLHGLGHKETLVHGVGWTLNRQLRSASSREINERSQTRTKNY